MNKRKIEYIIIAIAIILLAYVSFSFITYQYAETEVIFDANSMLAPSSSEYELVGNSVEFKNPDDIYDLNVTKVNSSDERVENLLKYYSDFDEGVIDYYNETSYLITVDYDDGSGFNYHSMIIPIDSFNKEDLSFKKDTSLWLFEGKNREFVLDSAFNSKVVL